MKKIVGLVLVVSAFGLGLHGLTRKESSPVPSPRSSAVVINSLDDERSGQRAIYFTSGGTLTINGNQAVVRQTPAR
jgi:hypothetical protein